MQYARHIIHRQSVEVAFERPGQEPDMHERLTTVYYQRVLPELDRAFGEVGGGSASVLALPALTIDCGTLCETNWEDDLVASIFDSVRDELKRYEKMWGANASPSWDTGFIHFLQTGQPLWDSCKTTVAEYETRLTLEKPFLDTLCKALQGSSDVLNRLFHYCSSDFIVRLKDALMAYGIPSESVAYVGFFKNLGIGAPTLAKAVLRAICSQPPTRGAAFASTLTNMLWTIVDDAQRAKIAGWVQQSLETDKRLGNFPFPDADFLASLLPLVRTEFPDLAIQRQGKGKPSKLKSSHTKGAGAANDTAPSTGTSRGTEVYYVKNAGLVLAYPFIAPLLQRVGFVDDEQRIIPEKKNQAAILLQRLVSESPMVEECDLLLNKLLVGLQPTSFVDPTLFEHTALTQRECESILHAIVVHWRVLRNTTVAGLSETFLKRDGKLTSRADGWLLQVETRGVDVLLASLPWSIGVIKLPWMDNMLYVEWS